MVFVIPIGAAATIDAAIRTRCCRRHVWAPIGGVIDDDDAIVAVAPAAPLLPPLGGMDPKAAALTKTRGGTAVATATATTATATAMATEEEECNGCDSADPRRCLDDSLLCLVADGILLHLIAVTTMPRRGGGGVWQGPRRR